MLRLIALSVVMAGLMPSLASAQQTRAELLEQQRAARAGELHPYEPGKIERVLLYIDEKRLIERWGQRADGAYPILGDFTTGSGLALGIGYRHTLEGSTMLEFDTSVIGSTRAYKAVNFEVRAPRLFGGVLELQGATRWWDYTQEDFFGLGESSRSNRADYRYKAFTVNGSARINVKPWFSFGEELGYLNPDVIEGTDDRFPSVQEQFTDEEAPGLTRQPRLVYTRTFVDFDYRDQPGNTRAGGRVVLQMGTGRDQDPSREFSYRRTDLEVLHVFPIFDKKRNFAVRFTAAHVDPLNSGGRVPFFLSPTIGGSRTLRSYRALRFRDATYVLFNAEYRWEAFSGLDLALFWDAGDVGTVLEQIRLDELKTGWGFGLRFNTNKNVLMRADVGLGGPEGPRLFLKFSPVF